MSDVFKPGDTAANTPVRCMHKLANAGWTHIEQQMDDLREWCAELYPYVGETCPEECKYRDECESESNRGAHVWDSRGYEVNADYIQHVKRDTAESIVRDLTLGNISESDAIARIEKLGSQHEQR